MIKDKEVVVEYLPNKNGHYKPVRVPEYIKAILAHVKNEYDYTFRLVGVNPVRPAYGVKADLERLEKWVKRYHSDFSIKRINTTPKHYFGLFELTDPVCFQLEKAGLL